MKRTVKAWAVIRGNGSLYTHRFNKAQAEEDAKWFRTYHRGDPRARAVPCTITYDDGVKPKRKPTARRSPE